MVDPIVRFIAIIAFFSPALGIADERPNIILLLCDDLRAGALGCMGHPWVETPNIDQLSASGVTFDNAFATTAICVTSRCNILTGRHAASTGWRHGKFRGRSLTDDQIRQTYLHHLKIAGYRVGYAGKWHVGKVPTAFFDDNHAFEGQGNYVERHSSKHLTSKIADDVAKAILKPDERPFFFCVGFKAPHVQDGSNPPFYVYDAKRTGDLYRDIPLSNPPLSNPEHFKGLPDFLQRSLNRERWGWRLGSPKRFSESVRGYHRLISGIDHAVGRIREAVEQSGQAKNTVIIFTSDHGVYLGDRGFAGKWLAHESSIRIPLIIHDPRLPVEHRARPEKLALTIDLAPTILDLATLDVPPSMQGESLLPMIRGEEAEWRTEFFYDHYYLPHRIPASEAVRTERWKYIRYINSDPLFEELYDLREDPDETRNLIGNVDYAFVHELMEKKWRSLRAEARSQAPNP